MRNRRRASERATLQAHQEFDANLAQIRELLVGRVIRVTTMPINSKEIGVCREVRTLDYPKGIEVLLGAQSFGLAPDTLLTTPALVSGRVLLRVGEGQGIEVQGHTRRIEVVNA